MMLENRNMFQVWAQIDLKQKGVNTPGFFVYSVT